MISANGNIFATLYPLKGQLLELHGNLKKGKIPGLRLVALLDTDANNLWRIRGKMEEQVDHVFVVSFVFYVKRLRCAGMHTLLWRVAPV